MDNLSNELLVFDKVSKKLGGKPIIQKATLSVAQGDVVGIVGANGSGKTTLLRLATGLFYPDQGEVRVAGKVVRPGLMGDLPVTIGALIESPSFLPYLSGLKNLLLLASIRNQVSEERVRETMVRVGLDPELRRPVRAYSLGMRQRLGIAQAIMEEPQIYIFDEPTNALDTNGVEMFAEILAECVQKEACVVLVSHDQAEIDRFCDRVYRVEEGRLISVREGRVKSWRVVMKSLEDVEKAAMLLADVQMAGRQKGFPTVICQGEWENEADLHHYLTQKGIQLVEVQVSAS